MTTNATILPFPRFSVGNESYAGITINLNAIAQNYHTLYEKISVQGGVAAVVKADAYGLGVVPVARSLYGAGCREFFVAYLDEAHELKQGLGAHDVKIYVLNGFFTQSEKEFSKEGFIPVLTDEGKVERWHDHSAHNNKKYPCVLHMDTGMHRTGLRHDMLHKIKPLLGDMNVALVMSHLSCGDDASNPMNMLQKERFDTIIQELSLPSSVRYSLANSAGISMGKGFHYDLCRPGGCILAGGHAGQQELSEGMENTFKVWTRIYQLQDVRPGDSIGYGATHVMTAKRKIATVAFGYADGCPWTLGAQDTSAKNHANTDDHQNIPYATMGGHKAPYVGRISMDLITLDVTDVPEHYLYEGAVVELIGKDVSVFDMARWSGTRPYEVMLKFGHRVQRNYIEF